ncbi:MAG: hypothetical protein ACT4TC_00070 [Myxococcaceae bacterium]
MATGAEEEAPPRGFRDRLVAVQVVDERTSLFDSPALTRLLRQLVVDQLKQGGARVMDEAPERLVISLREYQTEYDTSTLVNCVVLTGKFDQAAFLPGETRARRCSSDTPSLVSRDLAQEEAVMNAVSSAKEKPGLARALVGALNELMGTLARRIR